MGRHGGSAAITRGRTTAHAGDHARRAATGGRATAAAVLALACLAAPAAAQSTGGAQVAPDSHAAPRLSDPPPGVELRPAPTVSSWRCLTNCVDGRSVRTGSTLRLRGTRLGRTYEVTFLGADGPDDDVSTAPLRRTRKRAEVRVPLGAAGGPMVVADRDGLASLPTEAALTIHPPTVPLAMAAGPTIEVQAQSRRAFFDAERPAKVTYVVRGGAASSVAVELVRAGDGAVVARWDAGDVPADVPQTLSWDGTAAGKVPKAGRYSFRVTAEGASGGRAVSAQADKGPDPSAFDFLQHEFPVRGPHGYGEYAARFGGGRGHQGQDVFAACGTPLVAARGGVVKFKQYHSRAGHYLVIDGERTGTDYAYMHMRDAPLVDAGDRVHTGQLIGYVGQTGRATGCHLHVEMWKAPGWYAGGRPFDPLPSLLAWDKRS
jgi:murein DD-endopeptidase MepM/ murein hydrolase activator NlpD